MSKSMNNVGGDDDLSSSIIPSTHSSTKMLFVNSSSSSRLVISTTTASSTMTDLEYLKELHASIHDILFYYSSFVVLTGIVFNLLNFACFYRMKKRNSQNIYLGALSLADFFNIIMNLLVPMVLHDERVEVWLLSKMPVAGGWCVLYGYLTEVCLLMPVWIMVVLAAERFLSIMWPFRKNVFSTRRHAKLTLASVSCVIFVWSLYKLATPGVEVHSTFIIKHPSHLRTICNRHTNVSLVNFSTVLWAIVPEFLTLLLNLLIVKRIKTTTDPQKHFYPSERSKRITQATRVVLLLSIIFIASNSPTGVLIIIDLITRSGVRPSSRLSQKELVATMKQELFFMIARKVVLMFYETNLILSFPVYIFTIKNFKTTLRSFKPSSRLFGGRRDSTKIGSKKNGFPNPPPPTYNIRPNQIRSTINLKRHLKNNAESECLIFMKNNNNQEASPVSAQARQSLLNNNESDNVEIVNNNNNKTESNSSRIRSMRFNKSLESNDSSSHSLLNNQQTVNTAPIVVAGSETSSVAAKSIKFDKNCPACNPKLVMKKNNFMSKSSSHSNYSIYNFHSVGHGFVSEMEESLDDPNVVVNANNNSNVKKRIFSDYICNNNSQFYSNLLSFEQLASATKSSRARKKAKKLERQFKINGGGPSSGRLRLQQRVSNGF